MKSYYDVIIIGAGYYGCCIALHLAETANFKVLVVDEGDDIMCRASRVNQARVHGGYHYPRALDTGLTSRRSQERWIYENQNCITFDTQSVYGIARNSKVSANYFYNFCEKIGAPAREAPLQISRLFEDSRVESTFLCQELTFDAEILRSSLKSRLNSNKHIDVVLKASAHVQDSPRSSLSDDETSSPQILISPHNHIVSGKLTLNCTYANLTDIGFDLSTYIRKEMAEIAIIRPPQELNGLSITLMDGPFFSTLPFPIYKLNSLTHVRLTPVLASQQVDYNKASIMNNLMGKSINAQFMLNDASNFLPCMSKAHLMGSLFEYKAVLKRREEDDGRPILFEKSTRWKNTFSILGSKIDNIYDALSALDEHLNGEW